MCAARCTSSHLRIYVVELTNIITSTGTTKAKIVPSSTDSQHLQKGSLKDALNKHQINFCHKCVDERLESCCSTPYNYVSMTIPYRLRLPCSSKIP